MKRITPLLAAAIFCVAVASALGALQLLSLRLPSGAAAVVLAGIASTIFFWKQQAVIQSQTQLRRDVARTTSAALQASPRDAAELLHSLPAVQQVAQSPTSTDPASTVESPFPPDEHATPAAAAIAQDRAARLEQIGVWSPSRTSSPATGRISASVNPDPKASFRLYTAIHGTGASDNLGATRQSVAMVGSSALADHLATEFMVHRLHPRLSSAELDSSLSSAFVVEEDALDDGPWAGALEPHGSSLFSELQAVKNWMERNHGVSYVLSATGSPRPAAEALRAGSTVIRRPEQGAESGLLTLLMTHGLTERRS